jgi:superfamily I DNA/RNA helicase
MTNELTISQQKGVEITDRDLCVVAGPGSGKTRVLVERFANLVTEHNVSINEILTLTFTEKAANEMKRRAARLFEEKGMQKERPGDRVCLSIHHPQFLFPVTQGKRNRGVH